MCPSASSSPRCARSSSPSAAVTVDLALAVLYFTAGAQTPLLALLSLRRARNLFVVAFPYVVLLVLLVPLSGFTGLALLVLGPSPLVAQRLARAVGAPQDRVGALATATLVLAFPFLLGGLGAYTAPLNHALFAFAVGAAIAGAVPTVRDAMLAVLAVARYGAIAVILALLAFISAPHLTGFAFALAAAALVLGVLAAVVLAIVLRGDPLAAAIGGGMRDPTVAGALAVATGADLGAIPLAYAIVAAAALLALRLGQLLVGRQAAREAPRE